jgi:hypothetical protein
VSVADALSKETARKSGKERSLRLDAQRGAALGADLDRIAATSPRI